MSFSYQGADYQNLIRFNPPLTKEETILLFYKMRQGDDDAKEKLIASNLRLVISVCMKYDDNEGIMDDLIQEGTIGLMAAIDHFNPDISDNFASYAIYWIQKYVLQYFQTNRMIVLPENIRDILKKADELKNENPRSDEETLSSKLGIPVSKLREIEHYRYSFVELDDTDVPQIDEQGLFEGIVDDLLESVDDEKDAMIIRMYLGLNGCESHTFEQIGSYFGISKVAVQKRYRKAVERLKEIYDSEENQKNCRSY